MTISILSFVLALVLVLLLGTALGYAVAHARTRALSAELDETQERLSQLNIDNARALERSERLEEEKNKIEQRAIEEKNDFQRRSDENANILKNLAPLAKQLDIMDLSVKELRSLQDKQGEAIKQQLTQAQNLQAELRRETSALNTALTSTSARGYWGEIELRRLVESTGMLEHTDFDAQKSTSNFSESGSQSRPDMTIHLPGNTHIAVDAKAPLSALLEAAGLPGGNSVARADLLKKHAGALKSHINELAKRNYPADFPGSPTFTIMFVPAESLLSDALEASPDVLDYALRNSIIPATPSTLLLTLRTVATMWLNMKATEESEEIIKLGRELTKRLGTVANHLDKVGKNLGSAVKSYNSAVSSMERNLLTTVRKLQSFEQVQTPTAIDPDSAQIHTFTKLDIDSDSPDAD
ncbi:MAG: DNA recombination protein RmuC [Actinomycetaceae bacterium]|nr:DNA recombination protein RmuC [Actinomycetaceae bacterium]